MLISCSHTLLSRKSKLSSKIRQGNSVHSVGSRMSTENNTNYIYNSILIECTVFLDVPYVSAIFILNVVFTRCQSRASHAGSQQEHERPLHLKVVQKCNLFIYFQRKYEQQFVIHTIKTKSFCTKKMSHFDKSGQNLSLLWRLIYNIAAAAW